ncbi:MAG TPA: LysM domain-containing protein [Solirubrobacterales bacterium]|nr:LysM domain-containing protein [Solirubrobacterales bacterium]
MDKRTSAFARIAAAVALLVALLAVVVVISSATNNGSSDGHHKQSHHVKREPKQPRTQAKTYTVESGDTLTAIAHKTGVPVAEILALNPEVDPQILIAGETLKLR